MRFKKLWVLTKFGMNFLIPKSEIRIPEGGLKMILGFEGQFKAILSVEYNPIFLEANLVKYRHFR